MSFPAYDNYEHCGFNWLGVLPSHWEALPNKVAFHRVKTEVGDKWSDTQLLSLTLRGVVVRDIESGDGKYPADFGNYQVVEPDDLVMCLFDMDETPRTVGLSHNRGMITSAYDVFRCNPKADPAFVYYFYRYVDSHKGLRPFYTGLRKTVRTATFLSIKMPIPPLEEQKVISSFLDAETSKIDALVAEQRRLIELLKEKRQAVMSHAVTKGLNPNAPMKPSGSQWLGDVPEHWKVMRLRRIGRVQNGLNIGGEAFGSGDPFVSYGDVYNNPNIPETPSGLVQSSEDDQSKCSLEVGDVLFTRTSETADDIGIASTCLCIIPRSTFAGFLIRFRPTEGILDPNYSTYLFRNSGVQRHFAGTMNLVTRASLSQDLLKTLPICIPPIKEQGQIATYINEQVETFSQLQAEAIRAIELLQERRTALISAAVTGKIDIREFVSKEAVV